MTRLNKQEVFDKVASHLLTQWEQSIHTDPETGNTECVYRGDEGLMCAAGCIIPDNIYDAETMEGKVWGYITDTWFEELNVLMDVEGTKDMVTDMQTLHDREKDPNVWPERLLGIAQRHGVEYKGFDFYRGENNG